MSSWASAFSAATSGLSKLVSGVERPFDLGAELTSFAGKSPWRLYEGKRNSERVSVFIFESKKGSDQQTALVRNAVRRLRTIKHPYLLKCLDAGELQDKEATIYMVTEPVIPLEDVLEQLRETPGSLSWGVYTLTAAINFLSVDCKIVHGQVSVSSVFVDQGMDWKLGGFELLQESTNADSAYFHSAREVLPKRYQSPELARGNMESLGKLPVAADWWALGCTVFE
eukprot:6204121-Pleurochrysis_carterae.AAC.1